MVQEQTSRLEGTQATDEAIRSRVDELLAGMTPAEKAGQLTQYFYFRLPGDTENPALGLDVDTQPLMVEAALGRGEAGSLLFVTDPAEINRLQRLAVEGNRFGIPVLFGFDVIHGLRTIFPVPIAMAASWDPETIERGQAVAAREARAVGIHWAFAPMVDIARDPRWGRIIEGAGEDPFLGAAVAVAQVRGFQGERIGAPERIIAGPKHFAGYGAAVGGRDYDEVNLSDYELWNIYFPPFRAALEAGAGNVMTAYMDLNGIPATGNRWLFNDVLRDTFGFQGFVVSDANAVRNLVTHGSLPTLPMPAPAPSASAWTWRWRYGRGVRPSARGGGVRCGEPERRSTRASAACWKPRSRWACSTSRTSMRIARAKCSATPRIGTSPRPRPNGPLCCCGTKVRCCRWTRAAWDRSRSSARSRTPSATRWDLWCFDFDLDETVTVLEGIRGKVGEAVKIEYAPGIRPAQRKLPIDVRHVRRQRTRGPGGL